MARMIASMTLGFATIGAACCIAALLASGPTCAETLLRDDFTDAGGRYEFIGGRIWKAGGGVCRFAAPGREAYAVANLDELNDARVEATVTVARRVGPSYVTSGLTLYLDSENHWRLLLVAGPDDKAYFELIERYGGTHQAQSAAPPARTRLASSQEGELTTWEYGKPYRLTLTISPKEIAGEVRDPASGRFWRRTYSFATGLAVRRGRPGTTANGMEGEFRDFVVEGARPPAMPSLALPRGEAGAVAILRDEKNETAPKLKDLFTQAGFGATLLEWDDLGRGRLPAETVDLLVLADARRLSSVAARAAVTFLRAQGKLIAVGAPAFGEILIKTPRGYVVSDKYGEAVYGDLEKRPIALTAAGWRRSCRNPERKASIEPDGAKGWKVSADLDGWDCVVHDAENAFADGQTLLCFRAKGDADTPQLSIECREKDGARWIATVELSSEWRVYVLRPCDFGHWHDSKAKRGGPGDRLNLANLQEISFGLSGSHTPRCKPGPHTFWFADAASAADPNTDEPEVYQPDIEGLCPSYKIYPLWETASLRPTGLLTGPAAEAAPAIPFTGKGYSPVWREGGIGFARQRPWRWVRGLDAYDAAGRNRGALVSLFLGDNVLAGAMWASVGLADPADLLKDERLSRLFISTAKAMTQGGFLLEGGSRYFSYRPGEKIELGALVINAGRREQALTVTVALADRRGRVVCERTSSLNVPPRERKSVSWTWEPPASNRDDFPYTVTTTLSTGDAVAHAIEMLPDAPAGPDEFVRVEGSNFVLGGKPWYMLGMNYRPSSMAGNALLGQQARRENYDPVIIERDLAWMASVGINMLTAIHALVPDDPDAPGAYRDELDFLNRCRKHGMKVFYFLYWGNPFANPDVEKIKKHIEAAGIKDHPAILAWELAWEPIYYSGPVKKGNMEFLLPDWNAWIEERYGGLAEAEKDWNFTLERAEKGLAALPRREWCETHGPWDRAVAAFRRFFSDRVGRGYGDIVRELRRWDPKHLISFRFGACGIPDKARFAHAHSAAVAKHVDFMCPEGYNLQTGGWAKPTPPDDLRKGGLITLYYRFLSREKPVVWMEFGYTVNGFHRQWKTGCEHIKPEELAFQRTEYEAFYKMFIESGARGAAPWWMPGGFRLGENSDFGVIEPDGSERPSCEVLKQYHPRFAQVKLESCVAGHGAADRPVMELDFDARYADAWAAYSAQYLEAAAQGRMPLLKTAGTNTTSADCPLLAVGNTPCSGANPPQFLNAEFNTVEVKVGGGPWREVGRNEAIAVKKGDKVFCRASAGNTAEAAWLAPKDNGAGAVKDMKEGAVYLSCAVKASAETLYAPIAADTPYLKDAEVAEFALPLSPGKEQTFVLQLAAKRRKADTGETLLLPFGEKRTLRVGAAE